MPYRICKSFEIESGHQLSKHPDKCRFPHGHSRRVEFLLEADALDANDMVCDFKAVTQLMRPLLDAYDHALCVNTADPQFPALRAAYGERVIPFADTDPTTEVMAVTIFRHFQCALADYAATAAGPGETPRYPVRPSVRVVRVRVWETSSSWAEFWEEVPAPAGRDRA